MSEATATLTAPDIQPSVEAIDATADEATAKGTAADDVTVLPDATDEGEVKAEATPAAEPDADELVHSRSYVEALSTQKLTEGEKAGRTKTVAEYKARDTQALAALRESDGDFAKSMRDLHDMLIREGLDEATAQPIIERAQRPVQLSKDIGLALASQAYAAAIDSAFDTDAERKAFWDTATDVDPALNAASVLKLYAEHKALSSEAIATATPEVLEATNKALATYIKGKEDEARKAGRKQGQVDPRGEPEDRGRLSSSASDRERLADQSTPISEVIAIRARQRGAG